MRLDLNFEKAKNRLIYVKYMRKAYTYVDKLNKCIGVFCFVWLSYSMNYNYFWFKIVSLSPNTKTLKLHMINLNI